MRSASYQAALDAALGAAREAGSLLRAEFHRPGGPRGSGGHAEVDELAEHLIRILPCRPLPKSGTSRPRPSEFWPVDALLLAENLLVLGLRTRDRNETPE